MKYKVDLVCLLAFTIFSIALFAGESIVSIRTAKINLLKLYPATLPFGKFSRLTDRQLMRLLCSVALVVGFYTYVASLGYGGLAASLVRFYRPHPTAQATTAWFAWSLRLQGFAFSFSLLCIAITRLQHLIQRRVITFVTFAGTIALHLLFALPYGAAGLILMAGIVVVFADSAFAVSNRRRISLRPDAVALVGILVALGAILQSIRGFEFSSPSELYEFIASHPNDLLSYKGGSQLMDSATGIPDWTALCLENYGTRNHYLWFYTPYAVAVSFVPRSFWPRKPVGFGKVLAMPGFDLDEATAEASTFGPTRAAGLAGEGYANGGYFGVVILSALVGLGCGVATKYAVTGLLSGNAVHFVIGLCCRQIPPLCVRGDMLSAWGASVMPLVALVVFLLLFRLLMPLRRQILGCQDISRRWGRMSYPRPARWNQLGSPQGLSKYELVAGPSQRTCTGRGSGTE